MTLHPSGIIIVPGNATRIPVDEQYWLMMECRASGLTDHEWCLQHDIKPGTFYNRVKRLCQKSCQDIPDARAGHHSPCHQEVVKIEMTSPEKLAENLISSCQESKLCQVPDGAMELSIAGTILRIPNGTNPVKLRQQEKLCHVRFCPTALPVGYAAFWRHKTFNLHYFRP